MIVWYCTIFPHNRLILSNYASRYPKVLILLHVKFFGPFPVGAFLHYLFDLVVKAGRLCPEILTPRRNFLPENVTVLPRSKFFHLGNAHCCRCSTRHVLHSRRVGVFAIDQDHQDHSRRPCLQVCHPTPRRTLKPFNLQLRSCQYTLKNIG